MQDRDRDRDEYDPDVEDDDPDDTMPCPHCFGTIYDDSERCPHCGRYLAREDSPFRPPLWLVLGVSIGLVIVATWIVRHQ